MSNRRRRTRLGAFSPRSNARDEDGYGGGLGGGYGGGYDDDDGYDGGGRLGAADYDDEDDARYAEARWSREAALDEAMAAAYDPEERIERIAGCDLALLRLAPPDERSEVSRVWAGLETDDGSAVMDVLVEVTDAQILRQLIAINRYRELGPAATRTTRRKTPPRPRRRRRRRRPGAHGGGRGGGGATGGGGGGRARRRASAVVARASGLVGRRTWSTR